MIVVTVIWLLLDELDEDGVFPVVSGEDVEDDVDEEEVASEVVDCFCDSVLDVEDGLAALAVPAVPAAPGSLAMEKA
jgi:hypothetical protein